MHKKLISAITAGALTMTMLPCGVPVSASELSNEVLYKDILDLFYQNISEGWENYVPYSDIPSYGVNAGLEDTVSYLWTSYQKDLTLSEVGYTFIDLNDDGTDELIISTTDTAESGTIYDLYTIADGQIVHLVSSGERVWYALYEDHTIWESGSAGAATHINEWYKLENGTLELVELFISDMGINYFSDDAEVLKEFSESGDYSLLTIVNDLAEVEANTEALNLTPFSDYDPDAVGTAPDTDSDNLIWNIDADGVMTISGTGDMPDWGSYDGMPWYDNKSQIKEVIIEDGITNIGAYAFEYCHHLTSVTIPKTLITIEKNAFDDCNELTSVTIPESVTVIGQYAFFGCENLTSLTILNGVETIGNSAFWGCTSLTDITIPESVTKIDTLAFGGCDALSSVTIKNSDCEIKDSSSSIYNESDTDGYHFYGTIYGYVNSTAQAYAEKYGYAFSPIGSEPPNTNPTEPDTNPTEPDTDTENTLEYDVYSDHVEITGCDTDVTELVIPAEIEGLPVTVIANFAIESKSDLTTITIPASVTNIGVYAIDYCNALTNIFVDEDNAYYTDVDGVLYSKDMTTIVRYPQGRPDTVFTIPDGVTVINGDAFSDCENLETVNIPDSVTSIGAFSFSLCFAMESIYIPESVTEINSNAFNYSGLTDVYYQGSAEEWEEMVPDSIFGSFEYEVTVHYYAAPPQKVYALGDVNGDGLIDASDAAEILTEAVLIGAGLSGNFTDAQNMAGDINGDGTIDASDAAAVLSYAAAAGAGEDVTILDFVTNTAE